MTDLPDALSYVMPSAVPTDDDVAAWQALPREEQLRRFQALLGDAASAETSATTMSDILRRAQAIAAARRD